VAFAPAGFALKFAWPVVPSANRVHPFTVSTAFAGLALRLVVASALIRLGEEHVEGVRRFDLASVDVHRADRLCRSSASTRRNASCAGTGLPSMKTSALPAAISERISW
jgi:hypothetical protein